MARSKTWQVAIGDIMSLKLNGKNKLEDTFYQDGEDRDDSWVGYFSTYKKDVFFYLQESSQAPDKEDLRNNPEYCGCVNFELYNIRRLRSQTPWKRNVQGGFFLYTKDTTFLELCDYISQETGYVINTKILGTEKEKLDEMEEW